MAQFVHRLSLAGTATSCASPSTRDYIADAQRPVLSQVYRGRDRGRRPGPSLRAQRWCTRGAHRRPLAGLPLQDPPAARVATTAGWRASAAAAGGRFRLLAAAGPRPDGRAGGQASRPQARLPRRCATAPPPSRLDVLEPGFVETPVGDGAALPGVVDRFSPSKDGRRYVVRKAPRPGRRNYILKLPSTDHPGLAEGNEFTGYRLCQALGPGLRAGRAHSAMRRPDYPRPYFEHVLAVAVLTTSCCPRRGAARALRGVLPGSLAWSRQKYGTDLLRDFTARSPSCWTSVRRARATCAEFVRRFVAFILMGGCDAHLRTGACSTRWPPARLAPVYDPSAWPRTSMTPTRAAMATTAPSMRACAPSRWRTWKPCCAAPAAAAQAHPQLLRAARRRRWRRHAPSGQPCCKTRPGRAPHPSARWRAAWRCPLLQLDFGKW